MEVREVDLGAYEWHFCQKHPSASIDAYFGDEPKDDANTRWFPAVVPGMVHLDLFRNKLIPDPYKELNEQKVQWIGEIDWVYKCRLPKLSFQENASVDLVFDGLDTFADVYLNGRHLGSTDNMYIAHRYRLASADLAGETNLLLILFRSALKEGQALEKKYGKRELWNGDSSRLYVRKAGYHYGWDWGPVLMACGVWRPVRLEVYEARIREVAIPITLSDDLSQALIKFNIDMDCDVRQADKYDVNISIGETENSTILQSQRISVTKQATASTQIKVDKPKLWYPRTHGNPHLYTVKIDLLKGEQLLERRHKTIGFRKLRIVQRPLEEDPGTTFYFEVNNLPIFCGGTNWIPADNFVPRLTDEDYRQWIQSAVDSNQNMLRVWGGGIYEQDIFYDTCDKMGILVWQDFMFACGLYPAHDAFCKNIETELSHVIKHLRHHPCIALWCGNNEDYAIGEEYHDPNDKGPWDDTPFPARKIYELIMPDMVKQLDPTGAPYWPGSPYGGVGGADRTVGDIHQWNVWHGIQDKYQNYSKLAGRFVSEFGMEAMPTLSTMLSMWNTGTSPVDQYAQSRVSDWHNKATGFEARIGKYIMENIQFPAAGDLPAWVYCTQFIQAEAIRYAISGWRRNFGGPGHEKTSGALIWQLNDCWPVTSWAIADYYKKPKAAWYVAKREFAPIAAGISFVDGSDNTKVSVWGASSKLENVHVNIFVRAYRIKDGHHVFEHTEEGVLLANQSTELLQVDLCKGVRDDLRESDVVLCAQFYAGDQCVAQSTLWPEPFKYIHLPDPVLHIQYDINSITLKVSNPVKGLWLEGNADMAFDDNFVDVLPGCAKTIRVRNWKGEKLAARWLGYNRLESR
ncbi:hypothetical protein BZG36_02373 [Bifiguratus adelaidae]|uniref:Beta-mannosidase B n=1 Tax=Bifiguratus adelaidae TaxID=1938954 RepID=A0A261Y131_9FUNG|nr:hypothetical protein BZG36_02373 [Bifiguratus adelaidae]